MKRDTDKRIQSIYDQLVQLFRRRKAYAGLLALRSETSRCPVCRKGRLFDGRDCPLCAAAVREAMI